MKGLLLLSGGFDSPVAGYLLKKKKVSLIALHFSGEPFVNPKEKEKAAKLAKKIGCEKLIIFPFGDIQAEVVNYCKHRFYYIITKRIMFRIAEKIANDYNLDFIATGDNLGQVGSQTLTNLVTINSTIDITILQPLLTFDKQEIINLAQDIGTHDVSVGPEMCSLLGPKHPATQAKIEKVKEQEERLDINDLKAKCFSMVEVREL